MSGRIENRLTSLATFPGSLAYHAASWPFVVQPVWSFMELFFRPWWSALLAIVLIDLVAGRRQRHRHRAGGRPQPACPSAEARHRLAAPSAPIVVQHDDLGVVWLPKIPGLMLVGGPRPGGSRTSCSTPSEGGDEHARRPTPSWGAMNTIIVADALMGVDNVLGVAGAAKGSFDLVVLAC